MEINDFLNKLKLGFNIKRPTLNTNYTLCNNIKIRIINDCVFNNKHVYAIKIYTKYFKDRIMIPICLIEKFEVIGDMLVINDGLAFKNA